MKLVRFPVCLSNEVVIAPEVVAIWKKFLANGAKIELLPNHPPMSKILEDGRLELYFRLPNDIEVGIIVLPGKWEWIRRN